MTELKNDTFLRALLREPVRYTPVWMMRQAGTLPARVPGHPRPRRQLHGPVPESRACLRGHPAAPGAFPLDAAILFSDILTVPDAMGLGLYFTEGEGPRFERPVRDAADVRRLAVPDMEDELGYVMDAVGVIRRELDGRVPLIGFAGSPWTLATYMVEGRHDEDFSRSKGMMYDRPELMRELLSTVADSVTAYLNAQVAAAPRR